MKYKLVKDYTLKWESKSVALMCLLFKGRILCVSSNDANKC